MKAGNDLAADGQRGCSARARGVEDVQRSFQLFYDQTRSVKYMQEYEKRLIGEQGAVEMSITNGHGEAMELS